MEPHSPEEYCEAALPVPLAKTFTYAVPKGMRGSVQAGCRVQAEFGKRSLTGIVLSIHRQKPRFSVRPVKKLLDDAPALTAELIELGSWVAEYYCAPIGEVLRSMLPLRGETRAKRIVTLTPAGLEIAEASLVPIDVDGHVLESLRRKPLTLTYLARKHRGAAQAVERLRERALVRVENVIEARDPTLARGAALTVQIASARVPAGRVSATEQWLLEYLRQDPGSHDLRALAVHRGDVVRAARRLARLGALRIEVKRAERETAEPVDRPQLSPSQRRALDAIVAVLRQARYQTFLLHGVTGSGKTEVYLRATEEAMELGRGTLLLVPEIALTPALAAQFFGRFGDAVAVLHSALNDTQRSEQWRRIRVGRARVVLGTRSAVFAPVEDLGLVIVDEEHDASYKQAEAPRYNARDVAIVRGRSARAAVVVGSATPGLETRFNAEARKYVLLEMRTRVMERPLPTVRTVDMRREFAETGETPLFSRELVTSVRNCLSRGEQGMILLNRRGYSTHVLCRSCGERVECPNCSVTLTYHRGDKRLLCHYCDHAQPVPTRCPGCSGDYLHFHGSGSEKVEEELAREFPEATIARLDRDTVRARDSYETILNSFRDGECNLLVGTQMIAKGHDIPNVTLVCVVDADVGLGRPDFRAAERTFQLLTQVAGRAGRGEKPGEVLVQTMNPEHYAIAMAGSQDYEAFYSRETTFRKAFWYPPFTAMASILVRSRNLSVAVSMGASLGKCLRPVPGDLRLIGPASAPMAKLRAEHRFQFLIKSPNRKAVAEVLGRARRHAAEQNWPATALMIDVDPVDFL